MTTEQLGEIVSVWQQVQHHFEHQPVITVAMRTGDLYQLRVDATAVLDFLIEEPLRHLGDGVGFRVWCQPLSPNTTHAAPWSLEERCLEQLWLAINLAYAGALDLADATLHSDDDGEAFDRPLDGGMLWEATRAVESTPFLQTRVIPFAQCWNWLDEIRLWELELSRTPAQAAVLLLLQIASREFLDGANIVSLAEGFELLFKEGRRDIRRRVQGNMERHLRLAPRSQSWFTSFYGVRSAIAHGAAPIARSGDRVVLHTGARLREWYDEFVAVMNPACAAYVAALQELIVQGAEDFGVTAAG